MGMNYYAVQKKPTCKRPIHIGKSSYGWLFDFHDTEYWHTYPQVKAWLKEHTIGDNADYIILNEEDEPISYKDFIDLVDKKQKDPMNLDNPDNFTYARNIDGYRFTQGDFC